MKQIVWFRRDLRVEDSAILSYAQGEVLPIFIFDKNILTPLDKEDKRVTFLYQSVLELKKELQRINLDLAIFYDEPKNVFQTLKDDYDEVLCSCDFDAYAIQRDKEIESLIPMRRFYDSFLIEPSSFLKRDKTPYKVFTPFYKALKPLHESDSIEPYIRSSNLGLSAFYFTTVPSLKCLGFKKQKLPPFLYLSGLELLKQFEKKIKNYQINRDYFYKEATSNLSVHLRFGLLSPKQVFNWAKTQKDSSFFIRELFWREFYNYILYHFPRSQFENFNGKHVVWSEDEEHFKAWCEGHTGVPIIDAAMRHFNQTGMMHNRLRMIVASFLTKNLFLPWQWGEAYFASKLLDYEVSSNIGSWQWSASTGADSVPYFRVFNPFLQSAKFDKEGIFIKSVLTELQEVPSKLLHQENGVQSLIKDYPCMIVDIKSSRQMAIERFKNASM